MLRIANILGCSLLVLGMSTVNISLKISLLLMLIANFIFVLYFLKQKNLPQIILQIILILINIINLIKVVVVN